MEATLCNFRFYKFSRIIGHLPGVLGPAQGVAAVEAAVFGERVVSAPELARDLLVGGPAPADQHHVEPGQPEDRDEQERDYADQNDGDDHVSLHKENNWVTYQKLLALTKKLTNRYQFIRKSNVENLPS